MLISFFFPRTIKFYILELILSKWLMDHNIQAWLGKRISPRQIKQGQRVSGSVTGQVTSKTFCSLVFIPLPSLYYSLISSINWTIPHFSGFQEQAAMTDALCGDRQEPELSFLPLQMKNLTITIRALYCLYIIYIIDFPIDPPRCPI